MKERFNKIMTNFEKEEPQIKKLESMQNESE